MNRLERFFRKRATGVEVIIQPDDSYKCFAVLIEKEKRELKIKDKFEHDSLDDLITKLDRKSPLVIIINGKGVIGKKVSTSQIDATENTAGLLLPGASLDDFYIVRKPLTEREFWVSMIRKEILDDIVQCLKTNSFFIPAVAIGPTLKNNTTNLLDHSRTEIKDNNHTYELEKGAITDVHYSSAESSDIINIEGDSLLNTHIASFSGSFNYLLGNENSFTLKTKDTEQSTSDLWHKNVFHYGSIASLGLFFSVLLINFFFFDYFRNQYSTLQSSAELNKAEYEKLVELGNKLNDKLEFVESSGLEESSKTSFYADRLASSMPDNVSLNLIEINPLGAKIKSEEPVEFEHRRILISGNCSKSMDINNWIKDLKQLDWVKRAELKAFEAKNTGGSISNEFALEIEVL